MKTEITLTCPRCQGQNIKKNGYSGNRKQKYFCKDCCRNFIGDHNLTYKGCHSKADEQIWRMTVRGCGIRDIAAITGYSKDKVQAALKRHEFEPFPKQKHYPTLEIDEFWTFVGNKSNKVWLVYAYHRESGEIVAYVWGKRDLATARALKRRLKELRVTYDRIATDDWAAFLNVFSNEEWHLVGKQHTVGIEGNNCRLRHKVRRAFRKTCCFSKSMFYHKKVFDLAFFDIHFGIV
ncbi:IS1 family transposase [Kingella negevensis]|nr:IS1 family transposase [Kingella negevensis]MDK4708044.1 IS1 family transposase [Kingella negevensis]MDK4709608.1 IS1 family transposase [Kingella negevensis]